MPPGVQWTIPDGGFFIWLTLPESAPSGPVITEAAKQHFSFLSGVPFFAENPANGRYHIRLSFSFIPVYHFDAGIAALADAIRTVSGQ